MPELPEQIHFCYGLSNQGTGANRQLAMHLAMHDYTPISLRALAKPFRKMIKIGYLFESHAHFPGDQLFPVGQDDRIPDFFSGRIPFHFSVQGRRFPGLGMSIIRTNSVHLRNEFKGKKVPRTQNLYELTAT